MGAMAKKLLVFLLVGMVALAGVFSLVKNQVARKAVIAGVKAATGLEMEIDRLEVGLLRSRVWVNGIRVLNPAGFQEPVMADILELYADADLPAFFRGKTHLREMRLVVRELSLVKSREGKINLDSLTAVGKAREGSGKLSGKSDEEVKRAEFRIDKLRLKVGRVFYKDFSQGDSARVQEFLVGMDEEFQDVTSPEQIVSVLLTRTLAKTAAAALAGFDMSALKTQFLEAVGMPPGMVGGDLRAPGEEPGAAPSEQDEIVETLQGILEFGQEPKREPAK